MCEQEEAEKECVSVCVCVCLCVGVECVCVGVVFRNGRWRQTSGQCHWTLVNATDITAERLSASQSGDEIVCWLH